MRGSEASGLGALDEAPSTLVMANPAMTQSQNGFTTLPRPAPTLASDPDRNVHRLHRLQQAGLSAHVPVKYPVHVNSIGDNAGSTGKGILIGILSAFGSAGVAVIILAIFFFFKYTSRGRIILDRIGRPGEYDDEQAFAREEAEALEVMDDISRSEYFRAKGSWTHSDED